jgi:hypothetical protein
MRESLRKPPRWFDRWLCFVGWILLLLAGHCLGTRIKDDLDRPVFTPYDESAPEDPGWPHDW